MLARHRMFDNRYCPYDDFGFWLIINGFFTAIVLFIIIALGIVIWWKAILVGIGAAVLLSVIESG